MTQHPAPSTQHFASVPPFLGGVLLGVAATLKLHYIVRAGRLSHWPSELLVVIAAIELLVGCWMIVNARQVEARIVGVLVFAALTAAAIAIHFSGAVSCPCFGNLQLTPRTVVLVDVTFFAVFILHCSVTSRAALMRGNKELYSMCFRNGRFLSFMLLIVLGVIGNLLFRDTKSPSDIVVEGLPIRIGYCRASSETRIPVVIINHSSSPAHIFGGGTSCGCLTLTNLPVTVAANGRVELTLVLRAPVETGELSKRFVYYIEHPRQFEVAGTIEATVVPNEQAALDMQSKVGSSTSLCRVEEFIPLSTKGWGCRRSSAPVSVCSAM